MTECKSASKAKKFAVERTIESEFSETVYKRSSIFPSREIETPVISVTLPSFSLFSDEWFNLLPDCVEVVGGLEF